MSSYVKFKERECYKCGYKLDYYSFVLTSNHLKGDITFTRVMLHEIWMNDIFILECCWCFAGIPSPKSVLYRRSVNLPQCTGDCCG